MRRTRPIHVAVTTLTAVACTSMAVVLAPAASASPTPDGVTFTPGEELPHPAGTGIERTRGVDPLGRRFG